MQHAGRFGRHPEFLEITKPTLEALRRLAPLAFERLQLDERRVLSFKRTGAGAALKQSVLASVSQDIEPQPAGIGPDQAAKGEKKGGELQTMC